MTAFQMVGSGRACWEVGYFFSFSVAPNAESDMRLLAVYHDELLKCAASNPKFDPTEFTFQVPTSEPTRKPTHEPTHPPSAMPTDEPTASPTFMDLPTK